MKEEVFTVRFVDRKNCFLYFSDIWMQKMVVFQPNILKLCLKMNYGTHNTAYFSPSAQPCSGGGERSVGINATYAQMLGVTENEEVLISQFDRAATVNKINVCLLSSEDWEIMEVSMSAIQSSILDQVRIVWPGQTLLVWISKYLHFSLLVDDLDPNYEVGVLEQFTDLVVNFPNDEGESNPVDANQAAQTHATSNNNAISDSTGELNNDLQESKGAAGSGAQSNQSSPFSMWGIMKKTLSSVFPQNDDKQITDFDVEETDLSTLSTLASYKWTPKNVPFRLHPLQIKDSVIDLSNKFDAVLRQPFYVLVHKCNLPWEFTNANSIRDILVCQLSRVEIGIKVDEHEAKDQTKVKTDEDVPQPSQKPAHNLVYARLYVIEDIYHGLSSEVQKILEKSVSYSEHNCVLVPHLVQRALKAKIGSRLHLSIAANNSTTLTQIKIIPVGISIPSQQDLIVLFTEYLTSLTRYNSILLNNESVVQISVSPTSTIGILVKLLPSELNFTVLNSECIKRCNIQANVDNCISRDELEVQNEEEGCAPFFGKETSELLVEGSAAIAMSLGLQPAAQLPFRGGRSSLSSNVLVVGPPGSGKSTLCRRLCDAARQPPHFVHRVTVQCRHLKGKTVETLQKQLRWCIDDCVYHQPAILVLDDVDAVAGVPSSDGGHSAEEAYSFRVGEMIVDTLKRVQHSNYVLVMATAQSVSKLSASLAAPRGQHFFKTVLEVPELSQSDRLETLKAVLSQRTGLAASDVDSLDLTSHAAKADGYVVQDVADMVDKAIFHGWRRSFAQRKPAMILEDCDIVEAMNNTVPLSLRGVTLVKDSTQCWADVGGLTDVKQTLVEALQWPSMYAELFAKCPLRYQSGLLLYGAPGTGKTLLASAVARECGLNFISVKGPELLSKYIGASEEAVRNIFQKAQSARPCVLFFDEFDSLAPRRGHDSTGVTDRVVNQLLTQLDGVESLVGVWVVAATSRPDLLDPALLRPGRLDRAVLCSLPDAPDRLDILRAQSRKMRLADDVDLSAVAERTDGFTGADLQAVLYTAQMMAVEAACQNAPSDATDATPSILGEVTQTQLLAALADTRPSLPTDEKLKYKRIYDRFVGQRTGKSKDQGVVSQRVTLA